MKSTDSKEPVTETKNPMEEIALRETRVRSILKTLPDFVKRSYDLICKNSEKLGAINRMQQRLSAEQKPNEHLKSRLRAAYTASIEDSEKELSALRAALDKIGDIRLLQEEIRLISRSIEGSFRRKGTLMGHLQQAAITLPLWIGEDDEPLPNLCGAFCSSSYVCKPGDRVAAHIGSANLESSWILAEVVAITTEGLYEIEDVDADNQEGRYQLPKSHVVPLPHWRANPLTNPEAVFPPDSEVLALYPQTTCFYKGIVEQAPTTAQTDYVILFEDSTYASGHSPPLTVPQLYVVPYKDL